MQSRFRPQEVSSRSLSPGAPPSTEEAIDALREVLASMRFGAVALTVHDSRIVQMEVTEKRRF